jgi:hypothetical protein
MISGNMIDIVPKDVPVLAKAINTEMTKEMVGSSV